MTDAVEFKSEAVLKLLSQLDLNLKKIKKSHNDFTVLLGAVVFKDVMRHFENESGPQGKWKAWSEFTKKIRGTGQILQDTGRLRTSFKPQNIRKSSDALVWYNDAKTKSGFPYAFAHNTGGPKLPKRQFMWLSNDAISQIEDQTLKFLLGE